MEKRNKKIILSIVIPVYNEAETIEKVVLDFYEKVMKKIPDSEFVICEDGSTDGTKKILTRLNKKLPLTLKMSPDRKGAVQGYKNALKAATGEIILFSDSDGTHDPSDYFKLSKEIVKCDMVIGQKTPRKDPFFRLFISKCFNTLINLLFGTHFHDINSGFRLIKKTLVDKLLPQTNLFPACIFTEFTIRAIKNKYKVTGVPVKHFLREGESRALNPKKLPALCWKVFKGIIKLRFGNEQE